MIKFTIPGEPQGKARGRTFIHNHTGKATTLTPEKTVLYENLIKTMFMQTKKGLPIEQGIPIQIRIVAHYGIPASKNKATKAAMADGKIRPTKKPDADNVLKVVADALNGLAYCDDTQIVDAIVSKWYSDNPRVEVWIRCLDDNFAGQEWD